MRSSRFFVYLLLLVIMASCSQRSGTNEKGKALYAAYCQSCHMDDGKGVPGMNAPLVGSAYVAGDKTRLVQVILQGSAVFSSDPPRAYRNAMPPIPSLKDEEIASILSYVRSSFGNNAPEITTADVQSVREKKN